MAGNLLEVRNLKKYYSVKSGFLNKDCRSVKAVDSINLFGKAGRNSWNCRRKRLWKVNTRKKYFTIDRANKRGSHF